MGLLPHRTERFVFNTLILKQRLESHARFTEPFPRMDSNLGSGITLKEAVYVSTYSRTP